MIFPIPTTKYKILKTIYETQKVKVSDLIKEVHASQKTAYKYLNDLIKSGIISEELTGKKPILRHFKPNLNTEAGRLCFAQLETQKMLDFFNSYPYLKGPFTQFKKETESSVNTSLIFGSFAKGAETKESDIDVAIIGEKLNKKKITNITERCFVTLKHRASIRILNTKEFIGLLKNKDEFALQIMKNHIIVVNSYVWISMLKEV